MQNDNLFNASTIFGENVFNDKAMNEYLPKKTYNKLKDIIKEGKDLDPETADVVAHAMKEWAISKGATHFTHWFQPLNGVTAEKHDSFITSPLPTGETMMSFSGKELIKGEPDASSFPSGGLRATFEARGYTTWDCSSPAFVRIDESGGTLCIPTAFSAYTGESLDQKTPLIRSMEAIEKEAIRLLRLLGDDKTMHVSPALGVEQEYFLIDKEKFEKRKDLVYTGRTLFGAMPPKGQEMDDHYFGTIPDKVAIFMKDVDKELWKLGVPSKTEHNEVAPKQHELAPIYEECNVAVDHNQLTMEMLRKVANRHGLQCLLHEKPFQGLNGSGKHNNWSLKTDGGENLLEPGDTPHSNKRFLLVLCCILAAVDDHADLIRESATDVGNDERLGGAEAPPAVISVFLGEQLSDVINQLVKNGKATHSIPETKVKTGVKALPDFVKDATDRNRTSPFAFTGNKFEFRMVGSQDSVGEPNVVLNTIVAEAMSDACDYIESKKDKKKAIEEYIKILATKHQRIIFNGNGYAKEWVQEAKKRGLPIIPAMYDAIPALVKDKTIKTFEKFKVFTKAELLSRADIEYEQYAKKINIEAKTMLNMVKKQFIPATIKYERELARSINEVRDALGISCRTQTEILKKVNIHMEKMYEVTEKLEKAVEKGSSIENNKDKVEHFYKKVVPLMRELRQPVDELEMLVSKEDWPVPSYGDLLF